LWRVVQHYVEMAVARKIRAKAAAGHYILWVSCACPTPRPR
jgi:hypothetical protein